MYRNLEDASLVYRPRDPRPDVEGGELGELVRILAGLPEDWRVHLRFTPSGGGAMRVGQLLGAMRAGAATVPSPDPQAGATPKRARAEAIAPEDVRSL